VSYYFVIFLLTVVYMQKEKIKYYLTFIGLLIFAFAVLCGIFLVFSSVSNPDARIFPYIPMLYTPLANALGIIGFLAVFWIFIINRMVEHENYLVPVVAIIFTGIIAIKLITSIDYSVPYIPEVSGRYGKPSISVEAGLAFLAIILPLEIYFLIIRPFKQ
jgi:hypothetical protein